MAPLDRQVRLSRTSMPESNSREATMSVIIALCSGSKTFVNYCKLMKLTNKIVGIEQLPVFARVPPNLIARLSQLLPFERETLS